MQWKPLLSNIESHRTLKLLISIWCQSICFANPVSCQRHEFRQVSDQKCSHKKPVQMCIHSRHLSIISSFMDLQQNPFPLEVTVTKFIACKWRFLGSLNSGEVSFLCEGSGTFCPEISLVSSPQIFKSPRWSRQKAQAQGPNAMPLLAKWNWRPHLRCKMKEVSWWVELNGETKGFGIKESF